MSRDINDPRVQKILSVLTGWSESNSPDQAGVFVEQLFARINVEAMTADELRPIVMALINVADDDLLDTFVIEADQEREALLQCTIGNDISAALQTIGLSPAQSERLAHKAIADALAVEAVHS